MWELPQKFKGFYGSLGLEIWESPSKNEIVVDTILSYFI
ncbi:hypothetical protein LSS_03454 [Leptospira santarosai serovar Shermani str. LT 821]|uniref:Uncharacterized protein n=1 Tax=Leptospira santarosai serovar Shermani str. LT 821 TaxID=758847 RepID=K8YF85_9LEPT|nr:hypothetical protein LSS_03454 [Leptospira santarosai serovar Shermani str. LT 821]